MLPVITQVTFQVVLELALWCKSCGVQHGCWSLGEAAKRPLFSPIASILEPVREVEFFLSMYSLGEGYTLILLLGCAGPLDLAQLVCQGQCNVCGWGTGQISRATGSQSCCSRLDELCLSLHSCRSSFFPLHVSTQISLARDCFSRFARSRNRNCSSSVLKVWTLRLFPPSF